MVVQERGVILDSLVSRLALTLGVAASLSLSLAPSAMGKEGVVARLTHPLATAPSGGVPVKFVLEHREAGDRFSALGVFVRVRTVDGQTTEAGVEERGSGTGNYTALLRMRQDRITDLEIGLAGVVSGPSGTHRSDAMFPITNDPFPRADDKSVATAQAADAGRSTPVLGYALIAVGVAALVLAVIRFRGVLSRARRGTSSSPTP